MRPLPPAELWPLTRAPDDMSVSTVCGSARVTSSDASSVGITRLLPQSVLTRWIKELKMKNITPLTLVVTFLFTSCGGSAPGNGVTNQVSERSSTQSVKTEDSGWEVKVTKNGAELASYKQVGARGVGAIFDGKLIQMYLASPDNKHVLTIDIQGSKAGVYPLSTQYEAAKAGEARLNFMTEAPPAIIPAKGEVKLDQFNETSCSGSFTGTGTDIKGARFSIEGSFSKLVVKKHQ